MKDKRQNGHKTETPDVSHIRNVEVTHEKSDISVRGVLTFVVVLTLATAAISAGMWLLFRYFDAQEAKEPKRGPMALTEKEDQSAARAAIYSRHPALRSHLKTGRRKISRRPSHKLSIKLYASSGMRTSGPDSKIIPAMLSVCRFEQAMEKVVSSGLPSRVKGPGGKLSDYAISTPTASSSGREVEKRLQ